MKTMLYLSVVLLFLGSCKQQSGEAASRELTPIHEPLPTNIVTEDLQKIYCPLDLGVVESDITNNRAFLFEQHISPNIDDYPEQANWQQIDSIYQSARLDTMPADKKRIVQQTAAIQILRNHALLSQPAEQEKIAFYTKTYIESGGKSAGLLYYCLAALRGTLPDAQQKQYIETVVSRSIRKMEEMKNWMQTTQENLKGQELPPEVQANLKTDFANLENIVQQEETFVRKLKGLAEMKNE
jgi:hypothetical protein